MNGTRKWLAAAWVVGVFAWAGAVGYGYWLGQQEDRRLCVAANEHRIILRDILLIARETADRSGRLTPSSERFYARALQRVEPINCERS